MFNMRSNVGYNIYKPITAIRTIGRNKNLQGKAEILLWI